MGKFIHVVSGKAHFVGELVSFEARYWLSIVKLVLSGIVVY
jgi:hypothetical protein